MSKRQEKILLNKERQQQFLEEKKNKVIEDRWEQAQIQAATWQSVLDFAVDQYNQHKDELEPEMIEKTEEQITARQEQIKEFLMSEKEIYLASIGIQED